MAVAVTVNHNLEKMNKALDAYADKFNVSHGKLIRYVACGVVKDVALGNPVKTGRSRASWLPFLQSQGVGIAAKGDPKEVAIGMRNGKYKFKFTGLKPFASIWSNVFYLIFLEYGTKFMRNKPYKGWIRKVLKNWTHALKHPPKV